MAGLYDMLKEGEKGFSIAKDSKKSLKEEEPPDEEEPLNEEAEELPKEEEPPKEEAADTWGGLAGCAVVLIAGIAVFLYKKMYIYWFDLNARWGLIVYCVILVSLFSYIIIFLVGKRNAKIK